MKEINSVCVFVYVRWSVAHLHGLVHTLCMYFHACVCLCASVRAHIEEGLLFQSALLTDSLLVNEQLSAITIHEPCHSPPLSKHQHLKPLVSH